MATTAPLAVIGRRYLLYNRLGAGAMGAVFEAVDRLTGSKIALKRVHVPVEQLDFGSRSSDHDSIQLTLAQEFKILASLRHPNIISVLDYGFDDEGQPYITMELLTKAQTIVEAAAGKSPAEKIHLLMQMLQALSYLHRRGILHRDLKPRNVMTIDADGGNTHVKMLDFGLSVLHEQIEVGEIAGTPSYMAPELWFGQPATRSSDLWAIGVMAYEMFANQRPFASSDLRILFKQVRDHQPDLSKIQADSQITYLIGRLLAKDPGDRFNDVAGVLAFLQDATQEHLPIETVATRESFLQAASFVGREVELTRLTDGLDDMLRPGGWGTTWLIGGESGVGKSRLLDELRARALVKGAMVLRGQAVQEGGLPYAVWRESLRWLCLISELDQREASVLKAVVPDLPDLLGRDIPDASSLSAQADLTRLMMAIEGVFQRQTQPMLIILEDLHWADSESLTVLARLNGLIYEHPIMIVGSYRNDESPNLPVLLPSMNVLPLTRLDESGTAALVRAMLGADKVSEALLSLLQRETEGNVFFLVEVLRALAEDAGELEQIASSPLPSQVLTGGVEGIVRRRLSRVPREVQALLQVAAVGGRYLDLEVIRAALDGERLADRLDLWLAHCSEAAVLDVQDGQWRFAHNKLRDGVLADLPTDARRDLHRRLAVAIQAVYQYKPKQTAGALAYHWREAADLEKEATYAALAGDQAFKNGAYQTALDFLRRALELQPHVNQPPRHEAAILLQLGDTYAALGDAASARASYEQGLALCRSINYQWGVAANLNNLGMLTADEGRDDDAAQYFIEALQMAMKVKAVPVALGILVGMAGLLARAGNQSVAVEYAALAFNHPAVDNATHYYAEHILVALRAELPEETFDTAYLTGQERSLREVAARILEE
jgi:tetratricopeptide (TPR) repeat protein